MNKSKVAILLWVGSAIGAVVWLSFFSDLRGFRRALSQDDRGATAVAAVPLPEKKVDVVIKHKDSSCVHVERATVESDTFRAYVVRTCASSYTSYWELHIKQKSPDGTVISSWWTNRVPFLEVGERAEVKPARFSDFSLDPRTKTAEIYGSGNE